jgi:lipopolysaccharide cholinephosphotransferase
MNQIRAHAHIDSCHSFVSLDVSKPKSAQDITPRSWRTVGEARIACNIFVKYAEWVQEQVEGAVAGSARLEGRNLDVAMRMLLRVTAVLDHYQLHYSLDAGTLLGIVREDRLLPWDNDMDIAVPRTELPKLKAIMPRLWLLGYRLRLKPHVREDFPMKLNEPRILKVRNRKYVLGRGPIILDMFIKTKVGDDYVWAEGGPNRYAKKSAPAHYLDDLARISFAGKTFPIPADADGYLTHRYGDWRTPKPQWDFCKDDKALLYNDIAPDRDPALAS